LFINGKQKKWDTSYFTSVAPTSPVQISFNVSFEFATKKYSLSVLVCLSKNLLGGGIPQRGLYFPSGKI